MKIKKSNLIRLLGLFIFVYILYKLEWEKTWDLLKQTDGLLLTAAFILNLPLFWLKSSRWKVLLSWQHHNISGKDAFLYYLSGAYLGIITPGRLGDLVKVFYLKQAGIASVSQGLSAVLTDRLHDLYLLLLLGAFSITIYIPGTLSEIAGWSGIILLLLVPPCILLVKKLRKYIDSLFDVFIHSRLAAIMKLNGRDFKENFKKLIDIRLWQTMGLTTAASALLFFQAYLIMAAVHIPITYLEIVPIMALAELVSLLPISIAGLGTREAVLLYILSPRGIETETVILYSIGVFLISFIGGAIIGAVAWWQKPVRCPNWTKDEN